MATQGLLAKVKQNLIISYTEDDSLIQGYITAAISYAEGYQHLDDGYYTSHDMSGNTEMGVIMLASFYYESRDGASAGLFGASTSGAQQTMETVNMLLRLDRTWKV